MGRDSNQQLKTLRLKLKIPSDQQDLLQKLSWNDEGSGRNTGNSLDDVHLPPNVLKNLLNAHRRNKEFESKRLAATKTRERVTTQEQLSTPVFQTQIITNDQDQSPQPPPPSPPSSSGDLTSWASSHYDNIDKGDSSPCSEGSIGSEPAPKDANNYVNHDLRNTSPEPDETLANPQELVADAPRSSSIPELSVVVPQPLYSRKAIEPRIAIIQERSPESNPASPNESTRKEKKSDQTPLRYQNSPTPSSKPPQVSLCQSSARQSQSDAQSQLEARKAPVTGATTVVPAHSLRQSVAIDAPPCAQRLSLSPHSLAEVEVEKPKRKSRPGRMNMPAFTQTQSCSEAPLLPVEPSIRSTMPSSQISSPVLRSRNPPLHSQTCITETPLVALKQANPPVLADLQSSPPVSLRTKAAHTPCIATPRIDFSRAAPSSVPNPELVVPCSAVTRSIDRQSIGTHNRVSHLDTSVIEKTQRQPSALLSISRSNNRKRKAYVHSSYEQSPKERTIDRPLPEASLLTNSHPYATRTSQVVSCCSPNSASAPVPGPGPRPTDMIAPRSSSIQDFTLQLGMSPYDWFCSIYPKFVATHSSFANGIRYLVYLRNGKRLPECLYDDMLRAFTMEFPLYVSRTKKPMPAISWYMDRLDTPTYQSRAITHSNIDDIYLVTFGFPSDSTPSHHVSREAEEPASVVPHAKRRRVEVTSPSDYFIPPTMPTKLPSSTERTQIIPPSQPAINQPLAPKPTTGTRATSGQYSDSFPPGEQSSGQVPAHLPDGVSTTHASADTLVNDSVKTIQTAFPQREEPPTPLPSTPPHPMITRSRCSSPHHASVHRVSSHSAGKNKDACSSPPLAKAVPTDFQQRPSRARRVSAAVQKKKISLLGAQKRIKTQRKSVAMDWSMMDESSFLA
ncbi:hypothetical protein CFIMG_003586RA [Ceratocystis fimbriata CBS 114723]|uniref:Uncharacterized protein n=1 Tax=Ceratocystis fimbriata CBS 114723 TaxID=1035309 RepID=A0A2C5X2S1_9PEZI|nr:hypothetical protein CFIMG_003586RA [Ceratocystis fimbriata CBS 114723]